MREHRLGSDMEQGTMDSMPQLAMQKCFAYAVNVRLRCSMCGLLNISCAVKSASSQTALLSPALDSHPQFRKGQLALSERHVAHP